MFIGEEPTTPAIGDLDHDGDLEIVIQDLGGEVHVFATGADSSNLRHWWQFGADAGNTFTYSGPYSRGGSDRASHNVGSEESASESERGSEPISGFANGPKNPLTQSGWIEFSVAQPGPVVLEVHDIRGRRVRNLVDADLLPGAQRVFWDGKDSSGQQVARGIYFFRLQVGDSVQNRKIVLLR